MIAEFIITFREALEASLVIGIVLAYLVRTGNAKWEKHVWLGAAAGLVASVIVGLVFQGFSSNLAAWGIKEELFEGVVIVFAALMITWMILWMLKQKHVREEIEKKVKLELSEGHALGLAFFAMFAVLREGFETVIFLGAATFAAGGVSLIGALGGIVAAVVLAFLLFEFAMKINLKLFFNATSVVLIIFAAGLIGHAVHEFQEAGVIEEQKELWNTKGILDDKSVPFGALAHALAGYDDNPTPYQLLGWAGYFVLVGIAYLNLDRLHKFI